jgi:cytochrome c oxidase cbb3-type subunit I/II
MENPRDLNPQSIMPAYPWLLSQKLDTGGIEGRMMALRKVGVPYTDDEIKNAKTSIEAQSKQVSLNLAVGSITNAPPDREINALIAYLQRLGKDIKSAPETNAPTATSQAAR